MLARLTLLMVALAVVEDEDFIDLDALDATPDEFVEPTPGLVVSTLAEFFSLSCAVYSPPPPQLDSAGISDDTCSAGGDGCDEAAGDTTVQMPVDGEVAAKMKVRCAACSSLVDEVVEMLQDDLSDGVEADQVLQSVNSNKQGAVVQSVGVV